MKSTLLRLTGGFLALFAINAVATVHYVDLNNANPIPPFTDWTAAATNIQDAIDVSADGDTVFVTNGVYATGGKVMAGDLTNRVVLDKALTVQSVNGPWVTTIQGGGVPSGTVAVRCAWLTNGAALSGFTLKWGATRTSGDTITLRSGGGVWCASSNAIIANCIIKSNTASQFGGGAYQGTLNNCLISSNTTTSGNSGGGACNATLNNCTVVSNLNVGIYQTVLNSVRATNCIVYFNSGANYGGGALSFSYCCTTPAATGTGNFTTAPQLFADGVHLTSGSPCIGTGTNLVTGTDIFGLSWANPPSVGCAEFDPSSLVTKPQIQLTSDPVGFTVGNVAIGGQTPFTFFWLKDGVPLQDNGHFSFTQTTNLVANGVSFADAGNYQLVVSNAVGVVTSAVAQLVVHCVDVAAANPVVPYSTWATAATNIQDAITVSAIGEVVLVTNGLYAVGGKSVAGVITNRVTMDKPILVQSVNGPNSTIIQGAWSPTTTNGSGAVRCVFLTNNATLSGFTLRGGATPSGLWGGGVTGPFTNSFKSPNAVVFNCIIVSNAAASSGGGARYVSLINCTLSNNVSTGSGGGAEQSALRNCLVTANAAISGIAAGGGVDNGSMINCAVTKNFAAYNGGGASSSSMVNCTVTGNAIPILGSGGGGVANTTLTNCIVYGNTAPSSASSNYLTSTFNFSCTTPAASGVSNIASDPLLLADGIHLSTASPCIGAGAGVTAFTDIDGQTWNNPPAIGCDEWQPAPVIGIQPNFQIGIPSHGLTFSVLAAGQSPFTCFWSKDNSLIQDNAHHSNAGTVNLIVNNFGPEDAGTYQVIVSNSFGVVTSAVAQVVIHAVGAASVNPNAPYFTWATAATNIQDAIDAAASGDIVLVTNGIYATGGKVMVGDLTNRVVLDKAITVISVNGYRATVIQGVWDPTSTNGPAAIRCAWLTNGATLNGFTLQNGATRSAGNTTTLQSGGGVWGASSNAVVSNCILTNNRAVNGGGIAYGTLNNSVATFNMATFGGGAYFANVNNCTVVNNYTTSSTPSQGAGTYDGIVRNSIVLYNFDNYPVAFTEDNYPAFPSATHANYGYSCTRTFSGVFPSGVGNINAANVDPQFLDRSHIVSTSPCRGTGSAFYSSGIDLDGEPWNNPPSMGCDEVIISNLVGPLAVSLQALVNPSYGTQSNLLANRNAGFSGFITGRASRVEWSFGDGPTVTNLGAGAFHRWTNAGDFTVTFTAFNNDNPLGVSTNLVVHVVQPSTPVLGSVLLLTNGFQFQFTGQTGVNFLVQYATNLVSPVTWQTLQNIFNSNGGVHQITDLTAPTGTRFYRVLAQ